MDAVTKSAVATVRPVESEHPDGEFTLILSSDNLDRDDEHLWADEWAELPDRLHLDTDHAFKKGMSVPYTAGSGVPEITENGDLLVKGTFAGTPHGQLTRQLVNQGHVWGASVSYQERRLGDGRIVRELLNGTFTGVPANPQARVLASKTYQCEGDSTVSSIAEARLKELEAEIGHKALAGNMTREESDAAIEEWQRLDTRVKTERKARQYAGCASPAEFGRADTDPGDLDGGVSFKGFAPRMGNRIAPTSIYELDSVQCEALQQAAQQGTPFKVQVGAKGIEHGFLGGQVRTKAAVTAGGLSPLMPPIQQPGDRGYWGMPYELTRVANFLPNVAMDGPGIAYFKHTANAVEAGYTAEAQTKPDLTPTIVETYLRPAKAAGRVNLTHELVQDAGDAFANNLVGDLARSIYNAESDLLLNGTTGANGFDGINQVSNTLTRAADITDVDALDTLICVGDPRKGGSVGHFCCSSSLPLRVRGGGPAGRGQGGAPGAQ